jgi:hypothetical protein
MGTLDQGPLECLREFSQVGVHWKDPISLVTPDRATGLSQNELKQFKLNVYPSSIVCCSLPRL